MKVLTQELKEIAFANGVYLFGVAPVSRFNGAPAGHHPRDFLPSARSVISIGVPIPRGVLRYRQMLRQAAFVPVETRGEILQCYFYTGAGYETINSLLEQVSLRLANYLENKGFTSLYFPVTYGGVFRKIQRLTLGGRGIFSMRHAAVRAGLGEFGLNNLVVTPRYGPRVRFGAVITRAQLKASPLLEKKVCLGESCMLCLQKCGTSALTMGNPELNPPWEKDEVWLNPVTRTHIPTCFQQRIESFCYGRCIAVCPVGASKKTL